MSDRRAPLVPGLPFLGNALQLAKDPGQFWVRAAAEHGTMFRVRYPTAPTGELHVLAGRDANRLAKTEGRRIFVTRPYYERLVEQTGTPDYICALDGDRHRHFRRQMAAGLSREVVRPFVGELIELMKGRVASWRDDSVLPTFEAMQRATVELLSVVASGRPIPDAEYVALGRYAKRFVGSGVAGQPGFLFHMPGYKKAKHAVEGYLEDLLREHEEQGLGGGRKPDIMDIVLAARTPDGEPLPLADQVANAHLAYANGYIYGGRICAFLLYGLLKNPEALLRARAEAAALLEDETPTVDDLQNMRFLRNAIRETYRRHPIAPAVPRYTIQDVELDGRVVPKDSFVMVAVVVPHFDDALFADPYSFDPDRFAPPRSEHKLKGAYNPYGLGTHVCPAAGLIETVVQVAVSCVIHWLDLELVPGDYELKEVLDPVPGPDGSFKVQVKRREAGAVEAANLDGRAGFLGGLDADGDELDALLGKPSWKRLGANERLFHKGDAAEHLYVVVAGSVVVDDADGAEIATVGAGSYVGEIGLLHGVPRTAGVRGGDDGATLLEVGRDAFLNLVAEEDLTGAEIAAVAERRAVASRLLQHLGDGDVSSVPGLSEQAERRTYADGDVVIQQGDAAERFYVILSGRAEVLNTHRNGEELHLATLTAGEWFGELGLMSGRPRTATVRAEGELTVLSMDADGMRLLAGTDAGFEHRLATLAVERLAALDEP